MFGYETASYFWFFANISLYKKNLEQNVTLQLKEKFFFFQKWIAEDGDCLLAFFHFRMRRVLDVEYVA